MAKKQTRRSVSLSRPTYERLRATCEALGISMSQFVEGRLGEALGKEKMPSRPAVLPPVAPVAAAPPVAPPRAVERPRITAPSRPPARDDLDDERPSKPIGGGIFSF